MLFLLLLFVSVVISTGGSGPDGKKKPRHPPQGPACLGRPFPCTEIVTLSNCTQHVGCIWDSETDTCSGNPTPCDDMDDSMKCHEQVGCHWEEDPTKPQCEGMPTPCFDLLEDLTCSEQTGCVWSDDSDECSGMSDPCRILNDETTCDDHSGCTWDASSRDHRGIFGQLTSGEIAATAVIVPISCIGCVILCVGIIIGIVCCVRCQRRKRVQDSGEMNMNLKNGVERVIVASPNEVVPLATSVPHAPVVVQSMSLNAKRSDYVMIDETDSQV